MIYLDTGCLVKLYSGMPWFLPHTIPPPSAAVRWIPCTAL